MGHDPTLASLPVSQRRALKAVAARPAFSLGLGKGWRQIGYADKRSKITVRVAEALYARGLIQRIVVTGKGAAIVATSAGRALVKGKPLPPSKIFAEAAE